MAQDKVQLKREELIGNEVVLQDINPKTSTNSIEDSTSGAPLDKTLAMIKNMINNKLSRVVNSVNGRTGVVVLDAGDVGLDNVDNISFDDIKKWVIEYIGDIFGTKRIILKEYLTQIHEIIGTNDKSYADTPFYCEKGNAATEDYMSYIGYIYWDNTTETLKEEHLQIRVIGYTDRSLIYNNEYMNLGQGGLGLNIWSGEDALKIRNNIISKEGYAPEDLQNSGLYLDKEKVVPNVLFFDGVYGELTGTGTEMHSQNELVYWSNDPYDTTYSTLPLIQIQINGTPISLDATSGSTPQALHTTQNMKIGDLVLCNFSFDQYINNDDPNHVDMLYAGMVDALTCRQPALGRVIQAANIDTNTPCIVDFKPQKPNVSRGLKLINTNTSYGRPKDTAIGIDTLEATMRMNDGTSIYAHPGSNISGLNAVDKHYLPYRDDKRTNPKSLFTVYPTGKSNNLLTETDFQFENNSLFILPNFSMCVIPGYEFTQHSLLHPIMNWNPTSPMGDIHDLGNQKWNMIGINLEKVMWGDDYEETPTYQNARNISGLRVNTDNDDLTDEWFGYGDDTTPKESLKHSGGLSVNVGDFLDIGSQEELDNPEPSSKAHYYDEGKVNVRIDPDKGLGNTGDNRLGINIAEGEVYIPSEMTESDTTPTWRDGGLKFIPNSISDPNHSPISVNTGRNSNGLGVKNNVKVNTVYLLEGKLTEREDNVLTIQPRVFNKDALKPSCSIAIENDLLEEDIIRMIPISNMYTSKTWNTLSEFINDIRLDPSPFSTDYVYCAGGKLYIYLPNGVGEIYYDTYIKYYSSEDVYDDIKNGMNSGDISQYQELVDAGLDVDILRRQCHVLVIPDEVPDRYVVKGMIYQLSNGTNDLRVPDLDHNGVVDNREATFMLESIPTTTPVIIYSNQSHNEYYSNAELTTPVVPAANTIYYDNNDYAEDSNGNRWLRRMKGVKDPNTTAVSLEYYYCGEHVMSAEDWMNADVDRNGLVNQIDVAHIVSFYLMSQTQEYLSLTIEEAWRKYLRESLGIDIESTNIEGSVLDVFEYKFIKGVRFRFNERKGLTSNAKGSNDVENSLSIKIADTSAGDTIYDPTTFGGLRFGTGGNLGVRVNDNNNYNASLPNKVSNMDDMSTGTKGLKVYSDNVLGVQLTPDGKINNGELRIDDNGCLRLASSENKLKFSDGTRVVPYDGTEELTITLGPGLCFGPLIG
ncbi:MAG: hypothetical protein IKU29_00270 [Parabacteroides sp.]|nr:hypothetical protein [Parabacteroides sp.]